MQGYTKACQVCLIFFLDGVKRLFRLLTGLKSDSDWYNLPKNAQNRARFLENVQKIPDVLQKGMQLSSTLASSLSVTG